MSKKIPSYAYPFLQNLVTSGNVRTKVTSMAMGYAIASKLELPAQPSEVLQSFYAGTLKLRVLDLLDDINNLVPINSESIDDYTYRFYHLRHDQTFSICDDARLPEKGGSILSMWGFSKFFNEEEIQILECVHHNGFRNVAMMVQGMMAEGGY